MSEYKENTVGWWLSQLKEPLKSRALEIVVYPPKPCDNLDDAIMNILEDLVTDSMPWVFWRGIYVYYFGGLHIDHTKFKDGFDLAHECDPWREDKAIVDSPKKTTELFFYADETLINPLRNPFKEPLVISPRGEMNSVIVEEDKIKGLMNANPSVTFWPTNVGGVSPAPKDSWQESQNMGTHSAIRNHPKLGGKQPERAVVGYEEPKPIDTIEKKHELRIKNWEARGISKDGALIAQALFGIDCNELLALNVSADSPGTAYVTRTEPVQGLHQISEKRAGRAQSEWPFETVTPEQWEALTQNQKSAVEAVACGYISTGGATLQHAKPAHKAAAA